MRLIVDGSPLCLPLTGIGQYTQSLLRALAAYRSDWEFIVLSPYVPRERVEASNVHYDLVASRARDQHARGWRAWWFDMVLPRVVQRLAPQVFWAADGQVPFLLRFAPVVLTVYDFVPYRYPETMGAIPRYYRQVNQRFWLSRARWRLPISRAVAIEMQEVHGVLPGPVVYPGVDQIFRKAVRSLSADVPEYFVAVGTLEPRKNLQTLLHCVQVLVKEGIWPAGLQLCIVGGKGWRDQAILKAIAPLERAGIVQRLGFVPREELPKLLAGARALLMPSMYEGFGMPVAEALASGCPVVCSDIAPFREIAIGANALFHGTDMASMLSTYRHLLRDRDLLPLHAEPQSVDNFTWRRSAEVFARVLELGVTTPMETDTQCIGAN